MSLYGETVKIGGLSCGLVMRGAVNGQYLAVFEREYASLEQIEAINWAQPDIQGDCLLPAGYGFEVANIQYNAAERSYTVTLKTARQYLGDVAGYQAQVEELENTVSEQAAALQEKEAALQAQAKVIEALEQAGSAAELEEELKEAYEEGVESNG